MTHALKRAARKENVRVDIFSAAPGCGAGTTKTCTDPDTLKLQGKRTESTYEADIGG